MIGDVIGGLGNAIAGGLNYLGTHEANLMNREIMREQMGFQERMSNTAYQRVVQDMRAAGINPMLAVHSGGASSPAGASTQVRNELAGVANSARDAARVYAEINKIKSDAELTKTLNQIAKAELVGKELDAKMNDSKAGPVLRILERFMPTVNSAASAVTKFKK